MDLLMFYVVKAFELFYVLCISVFSGIYFIFRGIVWENAVGSVFLSICVYVSAELAVLPSNFFEHHGPVYMVFYAHFIVALFFYAFGYPRSSRNYRQRDFCVFLTFCAHLKSVFWNSGIVSESDRLHYAGKLALCNPYTRSIEKRNLNYYYALQNLHLLNEDEDLHHVNNFRERFLIGSCMVTCKFENAEEITHASDEASSSCRVPSAIPRTRHVDGEGLWGLDAIQGFVERILGLMLVAVFWTVACGVKCLFCATDFWCWVSQTSVRDFHMVEGVSMGHTVDSSTNASQIITADIASRDYTLRRLSVNRVEALLWHDGDQGVEVIRALTCLDSSYRSVEELHRVLDILQGEGNVIFSDFHVCGSRAHAEAYGFDDMVRLVLRQSMKLVRVDVSDCDVTIGGNTSGTISSRRGSELVLTSHPAAKPPIAVVVGAVANLAITILGWFFLQLTALKEVALPLAIISMVWAQMFGDSGGWLVLLFKKLVYYFIYFLDEHFFIPGCMDRWYRDMQFSSVLSWLTFGNQSYGYPVQLRVSKLIFVSNVGLPVGFPEGEVTDVHELHPVEVALDGLRKYHLRNIEIVLMTSIESNLSAVDRVDSTVAHVDVRIRRHGAESVYWRRMFLTTVRQVRTLHGLLKWQIENQCSGVVREWPTRNFALLHTYEDLIFKILDEDKRLTILSLSLELAISFE